MAQSLQNQSSSPAYLDYFGMTQPPFAALPEPSPMFLSEQHSLLMSHLSLANEQADRILLICGAQGSGKTTLLNQYISELGDETWFATLDDGCTTATHFYCDLLGQLGFPDMSGGLHELRNITREFLVHRGRANDHILLLIDNAHRLRPTIFAQLRWISDITCQDRRVVSIVLSGSPDLPEILDSEAMKAVDFADRTDFTIRTFSAEETFDYIAYRLRMAGGSEAAQFSSAAKPLIYSYSGGIPELINLLCDAVLAEAYACGTKVISEALVNNVAKANEISQNSNPSINRGRRKSDVSCQQTEAPEQSAGIEAGLAPAMDRQPPPDSGGTEVIKQHRIQEIVERRTTIEELEERLVLSESECERIRSELATREEEISDLLEQAAQMDAIVGASILEQDAPAQEQDLTKTNESADDLEELLRQKDEQIADLVKKLDLFVDKEKKKQTRLPATRQGNDSSSAPGTSDTASMTEQPTRPIGGLEIFRNATKVRTVKVADDVSRIMVGRGDDCELHLDSKFVSSHHAIIFFGPKGARIEDLNSFNGTIVNSSRVSKLDLSVNDDIVIGDFQIRPT